MNAEALIGSLVRGVLVGGSRRKRGYRASRLLTGGGGSLLNAGTLLTLAGPAWGLYESSQPKNTISGGTLPPPAAASPAAAAPGIPPEVVRLVRLIISAARADGQLSPAEMEEILSLARQAGAESLVQQELQHPMPLAEIVGGVSDPGARKDLYTLAFTIAHADEGVSGAEKIYLAELALQLGLDAKTTSRLEGMAASKLLAL